MKSALIVCAIAAAFVEVAAGAAASAPTSYPPTLHGIWFDDSIEGKAQCVTYRNANKTDDDDVSLRLVGAMVISTGMIHDYAEYGEGNFYALRKLEKTGRSSWRAAVAIGIDTVPETSQPVDETLTLRLSNGRLVIASKPPPLNIKGSWQVSYNLRRCADVPNGMYGTDAKR